METQFLAQILEILLMGFEISLLLFLILKIRRIIRTYRILSAEKPDFIDNLQKSLNEVIKMNLLTHLLTTEISLVRYGLLFFIGKKEQKEGQKTFTIYQNTGFKAVWITLLLVCLVELFAVHLLVGRFSPVAAWVLSAISLYGLLFLVAYGVAIFKRPSWIENGILYYRLGLLWRAKIPLSQIKGIRILHFSELDKIEIFNLGKPLLASPEILLEIKIPITFSGIYGRKKTSQMIGLVIDQKEDFLKMI